MKNKHHVSRLTRRQLLVATAAGASCLALPRFLRPNIARGQEGAELPRLVFFHTDHGTQRPEWRFNNPNALDRDHTMALEGLAESDFGRILRPLHPYRQELNVLDGLSLMVAYEDLTPQLHTVGAAAVLTGRAGGNLDGRNLVYGDAPSVDQIIADGPGREGAFHRSMLVQCRHGAAENNRYPSWRGPNDASDFYDDTADAFAHYFSVSPRSEEGPDPLDIVESNLIEFVAAEYGDVASTLGQRAQVRLNQHRDLLADMRSRQSYLDNLSCDGTAPTSDIAEEWANTVELFSLQVAAALSCGLSRVVVLGVPDMPSSVIPTDTGTKVIFNGETVRNSIHDVAHGAKENGNSSSQALADFNEVLASKLANLAGMLEALPTSDGNLLEHSMLWWSNTVARGDHTMHDLPLVGVGGSRTGLRTGNYHRWAPRYEAPIYSETNEYLARGANDEGGLGPAQNHWLVSLCHLMGMPEVDQVGSAEFRDGSGGTVDLRGPLTQLSG